MMDAHGIWLRLGDLASGPPTAEARAEVTKALASDVGSIRNAAAVALSTWSDAESIDALRALLVRGLGAERFAWAIRSTAIKALARCIGDTEATWILDLYFSISEESARRELFPLFLRLSNAVQRDRLVAESASEDPTRRRAALAACAVVHLDEEPEMVKRLSGDSDNEVASLAERCLERVRRREQRHQSDPLLQALVRKFRPMLRSAPNSTEGQRAATRHAAHRGLRIVVGEHDAGPRQFFVKEQATEIGEVLQCWRLSSHALERVPPSSWRGIGHGPVNGTFFESGIIEFWLSEPGEELFVDLRVSPFYGRGWTYKLRRDDRGVRLEDETVRWFG